MTLRPLALGLALLLPATSGCGVMQFVEDIDETHVNALPLDDRPTVLVRLERGEDGEDLLASFHAPFSLPLFASVAYQQGTEHMSTRADYVLDMSVREGKPDINAYSVVAACTLGALPIPLWEEYRATIEVRDSFGASLGTIVASGEVTSVLWLAALPLNLAFSTVDPGLGLALGLNVNVFESEKQDMIEALVRKALIEAHERFRFVRPGPRTRQEETALDEGK